MDQPIYIHMGMMKTGTTFLQHRYFPELEMKLLKRFTDLKNYGNNSLPFLISNEGLSGSLYKNEGSGNMFESFRNSLVSIKSLFKDPKIIICFREPSAFLVSSYKQYLHEGGVLSFEQFYSKSKQNLVDSDDLKFDKYIDEAFSLFDRKNLFIYDYESFRNNPQMILDQLCFFMNHDKVLLNGVSRNKKGNPSVPFIYENLLRVLNKLHKILREYLGLGLHLKLFGKLLSPRTLCQYALPRFYRPSKERDVESIRNLYKDDWQNALQKMDIS